MPELKEWVKDSKTHNYCPIADIVGEGNINPNVDIIETRVNELSHALMKENCSWKGKRLQSRTSLDEIPQIRRQAFISDISYAYNLNKLQHVAFSLIAISLIKRWRNREMYKFDMHNKAKLNIGLIDSIDSNDQLCMVLVGEGGTGKSRVITAVDALCLAWDNTHSLIKAAPTGKAAVLINGRTLASVLIRLKHSSYTNSCLISCIIIDEMSMMTLQDLYELDVNLRRITGIKMLFGGVSIVLCGDFLQLPPVGGRPLYKRPVQTNSTVEAQKIKEAEKDPNYLREKEEFLRAFHESLEIFAQSEDTPKKKCNQYRKQVKLLDTIYG